jgi:hypothetical protein
VTRVYVPATPALLARWHADGSVPADAERYVAPAEDEEAEYAALMTAAEASAALLAGPGRRVVVVAEAPEDDVAVPFRDVASVHADTVDRPAGSDPDEDLAWYATQEIPGLLGESGLLGEPGGPAPL